MIVSVGGNLSLLHIVLNVPEIQERPVVIKFRLVGASKIYYISQSISATP
jgi:hypothetical protein